MLEKDFKKMVKRDLDSLPNVWYFVKEAASIRGLPDIIGVVNGQFFALELKAKEPRLTGRAVLQSYQLEKIQDHGGYAMFAYPENWEHVLNNLKELSSS